MQQRTDKPQPPFDAILKRWLDSQRIQGGSDCPDAATLAAYCERSLPSSQSSRWEEHFSNCARCQGALAAIARAQTPQRVAPPRTFARRWELYAALAAGVAGISIVTGLMRTARHQVMPADTLARNKLAAPAQVRELKSKAKETGPLIALNEPAPQANPVAEARRGQPSLAGTAGGIASSTAAQRPSAANESAPESAERIGPELSRAPTAGAFGGVAALPAGAGRQQQMEKAAPRTMVLGPPASAPPQPPPAIASMERDAAAPSAPVPPAPAPGMFSTGPQAPSIRMETAVLGKARRALGIASVFTADGIERWRLGAHGAIKHRGSDGQWMRQHSGVTTDLTAGAAPSPSVCWVVGKDGAILRTTDGERWNRLDSPTSVNLIAVSAIDASSAVITTADGRRFSTNDAGQSWRQM